MDNDDSSELCYDGVWTVMMLVKLYSDDTGNI